MPRFFALVALIPLLLPSGVCLCGASCADAIDGDDHVTTSGIGHSNCSADTPDATHRHTPPGPDGRHEQHAPSCPAVTASGTRMVAVRDNSWIVDSPGIDLAPHSCLAQPS